MDTEKKCQECCRDIIGRSDKRFCSDQCRTSYNNRLNSDRTNYMRKVNRILRKNRKILQELNPNGKTKVHRRKLLAAGFNFTFHTNVYTTKTGNSYFFCYEQGYLSLEENYLMLVEREEYVD